MLFQPEARGDDKGDAARITADDDAAHLEEDAEVHPRTDPQPENAEGGNQNDKTEV
jgi:hypothetical protein